MKTFALAAVTAAVLLAPTAAPAAAPWTAPAPIPGTPAAFSGLTYSPLGVGFAGWSSGGGAPSANATVSGVPLTPDGGTGAARELAQGMVADFFDSYAPNRLIAVGTRYTKLPRPLWSLGRVSGALGRPRALAGGRRGYAAGLAVNTRGDAAAILRLCESSRRCRRPTPYLVVRRPNRQFGTAIRLDTRAPVYTATVAINERGDVLAVWDRPLNGSTGRRGIYTRIRTAGGRLGATQRVGTSQPLPKLSASLGEGRSALVGWVSQRISEGHPLTDAQVWLANAEPRRRFGAPQRVETVPRLGTGRYVGQAGVVVKVAPDRRKLAAWTGYSGERFVVRAGSVEGGEAREPVQTVSDPGVDTVLGDLETGPGGESVILGLAGIRGADPAANPAGVGIVAAVRQAGAAAFGRLETVAEPASFREDVEAEFVPTNGRIVAVWRDLGTNSLAIASREPAAYTLP